MSYAVSRRSFVASAAALLLAGCAQGGAQGSSSGAQPGASSGKGHAWASSDQAHVVATFYPMADFATKVGGTHAEVVCLVPAGTEPHDWEPTPDDLITIQTADLVVRNGAGMDDWLDGVLSSLGGDAPASVCASDGISLRTTDHGTDPHVWLDPNNASVEASNIAGALAQAKPEHAGEFHSNLSAFVTQLGELSQEFARRLTSLPKHEIVVSHEAYGYLCDAFGLTQTGIEGLSPDSEPDAARMAEIVDLVKAKGITTIFFEELVSPKVAETIAAETGATAVELSPLEGLTSEQLAAGEDYLSVMRDNLEKLEKALS